MNACRMEKAYRHFGHDIGVEDTPIEAGLGFAVAWDKPGFIGRDALLRQREAGPPERRLVQFRLADDRQSLHHEEPIWAEGQIVGLDHVGHVRPPHRRIARHGLRAHREGGVTREWLDAQRFEIEIGWQRFAAEASLAPFYDPGNSRIRG
jgi:glycine cleavage system aminomethyltransferase T